MTGISTHVLDIARGKPAPDVPVRLERQESSGEWRLVGSARSGPDGRCGQILAEGERLSPGTYRLAFDTASYFSAQGMHGFFPAVLITFSVLEGEKHFHIPLLLSPHGYTTYRGS
jgi:5-hydroxyisourate hydrolase